VDFIIPCNDADEEEDQEEETTIQGFAHLEPGPQVPLKEQLEKDKEDESLRRWKEQLLGYVASLDTIGDRFHSDHPEVKVSRLGISAKGREEFELPLALTTTTNTPQGHAFCLKEASYYQLKFIFTVRNNIVSGLTCINTVWKAGIMVLEMRSMLGTFTPQQEPYVHILAEHLIPSGAFARGPYSARTQFIDDDGTVYLDVNYSFEICKDW
jgi:Rho GDP-dissociation inhibitor